MRSVKIFALGIVGLAAAFLLPAIQSYLLLMMAISPLVLLVLGQFWLPRSKRIIQVWINPLVFEMDGEIISAEPGTPFGRLSGKDLAYSFFKQWHEFEIITHRHWLLAAVGFSSLAAVWLAWSVKDSLFAGISYFYMTVSIWGFVISLAARWIFERRMLRLEGVSMGSFSAKTFSKPAYRQIRYHFVDVEGHYRGGCFDSVFCDRRDDMNNYFLRRG
ncbi:MAG TPA: hypothetical protein VGK24_22200 [Candidatus Angelobacter sp.]|jgi:hypothetical protein